MHPRGRIPSDALSADEQAFMMNGRLQSTPQNCAMRPAEAQQTAATQAGIHSQQLPVQVRQDHSG